MNNNNNDQRKLRFSTEELHWMSLRKIVPPIERDDFFEYYVIERRMCPRVVDFLHQPLQACFCRIVTLYAFGTQEKFVSFHDVISESFTFKPQELKWLTLDAKLKRLDGIAGFIIRVWNRSVEQLIFLCHSILPGFDSDNISNWIAQYTNWDPLFKWAVSFQEGETCELSQDVLSQLISHSGSREGIDFKLQLSLNNPNMSIFEFIRSLVRINK